MNGGDCLYFKIPFLRDSSNRLYSIILFYLNFLHLQLDFIRLLDILAKIIYLLILMNLFKPLNLKISQRYEFI